MSFSSRPTIDEVWIQVADVIRQRSLCDKAKVAAVIVDQRNRIVSTGYNGPPAGFEHNRRTCNSWCPARITDQEDAPCYSVHAEANAIITGERSTWQGGTMFGTKHPCWDCCKLIANSGLSALVIRTSDAQREDHTERYHWLMSCGVSVRVEVISV